MYYILFFTYHNTANFAFLSLALGAFLQILHNLFDIDRAW